MANKKYLMYEYWRNGAFGGATYSNSKKEILKKAVEKMAKGRGLLFSERIGTARKNRQEGNMSWKNSDTLDKDFKKVMKKLKRRKK